MKRALFLVIIIAAFFIVEQGNLISLHSEALKKPAAATNSNNAPHAVKPASPTIVEYKYPEFYRGIYLNVYSAKKFSKLKHFVEKSKKSNINAFVIDAQSYKYKKNIIPPKHIKYVLDNGIHPIARIVCFPEGLKYFPVSKKLLKEKLLIAESCAKAGFKEIQFDYIRFNDSNRLKHLSVKKRQAFIEGFLASAKKHLKKYNVKIAADIFGRIPLNRNDIIGQHMESLDKVVDIICPMAYPSHYWTKKLRHDPYYTVKWTSENARKRAKTSEIVTYIQAFKMKMPRHMSYNMYIQQQVKACHDAGIKGFLLWNARQDYKVPFVAIKSFYSKKSRVSTTKKSKTKDKIL